MVIRKEKNGKRKEEKGLSLNKHLPFPFFFLLIPDDSFLMTNAFFL